MTYKTETRWLFELDGKWWAIDRTGWGFIEFEEVEKNGQEDTHMSGRAECGPDGRFRITEGRELLEDYGPGPKPFEDFFTMHGVP